MNALIRLFNKKIIIITKDPIHGHFTQINVHKHAFILYITATYEHCVGL